MATNGWLIVLANALAASILLFAALTKLAAPAPLGRSLQKLTSSATLSSHVAVRAIGVLEATIAFAVLINPIRAAAGLALGLLGLTFVSLGVVGRVRRIDEPCGCFGAASQQPLGTQNIVLGALLVAIAVSNLTSNVQLSQDARAAAPIITAGLLGLAGIATGRSVQRRIPISLN